MPATTVVSESRTHTIELAVTDAPPLKVEFVYYEVTGLRLTYVDDELTDLVVIGVAEDTGETEKLATRMSAYEMVQPWIRDEVEKHRPSRALHAFRAKVLNEAADLAGEPIPEGAPAEDWEDLIAAVEAIRERAAEAERQAVPAMDPTEFVRMFLGIPG